MKPEFLLSLVFNLRVFFFFFFNGIELSKQAYYFLFVSVSAELKPVTIFQTIIQFIGLSYDNFSLGLKSNFNEVYQSIDGTILRITQLIFQHQKINSSWRGLQPLKLFHGIKTIIDV